MELWISKTANLLLHQTIIILIDCLQAWFVIDIIIEVMVEVILKEVIFVVYKLLLYESIPYISALLSQTSIIVIAVPYQLPLENNPH